MSQTTEARQVSGGTDLRAVTAKSLRLLAALVRLVTLLFAAVLVVHVVLTVAGANPANNITIFFGDAASALTLGLRDLFLVANPSLQVILNFGVPAVVWILIGMVISKIVLSLVPRRGRGHGG